MDWAGLAERASTPLALLLYLGVAAALSWLLYRKLRGNSSVPATVRGAIFSILGLGLLPALLNFSSFREYSFMVQVLDTGDYPTTDASLKTSAGSLTKTFLGWQLNVPVYARIATSRITLRASSEGLTGLADVPLGKDHTGSVVVQLDDDKNPSVRGFVVDTSGTPIDFAVVIVTGHPTEAVITQLGGRFTLPAHAARDEYVWVHAEAHGRPFGTEWLKAGGPPGTITLGQQSRDGR